MVKKFIKIKNCQIYAIYAKKTQTLLINYNFKNNCKLILIR